MVSWVKTNIPIIINNIITFFKQLPGKIWNAIVGAVTKIATWGANMKEKASTAIRNMISSVISTAQSLPGKIWSAIVGAIDKMTTWGSQMLSKAKSGIKNVASAITNGLKSVPSKLGSIGRNIVEGLWNGIKNATGWIKDKVAGFAQGILDGMKDALGINSPSRVFRDEVGRFIPEGVGVGIEENEKSALNAVDTMSQDLLNQAQNINGVTLKRQLETTFRGSVDSNNTNILNRLDTIVAKLERKSQILLDGRALVGETIDYIDSALATNQSLNLRGV
jgi:phage-related protein